MIRQLSSSRAPPSIGSCRSERLPPPSPPLCPKTVKKVEGVPRGFDPRTAFNQSAKKARGLGPRGVVAENGPVGWGRRASPPLGTRAQRARGSGRERGEIHALPPPFPLLPGGHLQCASVVSMPHASLAPIDTLPLCAVGMGQRGDPTSSLHGSCRAEAIYSSGHRSIGFESRWIIHLGVSVVFSGCRVALSSAFLV